jgi:hypothetical protein
MVLAIKVISLPGLPRPRPNPPPRPDGDTPPPPARGQIYTFSLVYNIEHKTIIKSRTWIALPLNREPTKDMGK